MCGGMCDHLFSNAFNANKFRQQNHQTEVQMCLKDYSKLRGKNIAEQ